MNINLHIDRLVLEGFPVRSLEGTLVRIAVERELARLLAESGLPERWRGGGAVPQVLPPQFSFVPGARPAAIGRYIARSVYRGIGGAP
jgi:hypothetical protein